MQYFTGKSSASIMISVRSKPGEFPTSEEIQRQSKMDIVAGVNPPKAEGIGNFYPDDQSHEQRPDGAKTKYK